MYQEKKVVGIVAEFNPFHEGHAYLLQEARNRFGAEYVVIVMSGDFVQRGEPAIVSKYDRTRDALTNGADLVLQLPVMFSTAAAEDFASGGVALLARTGICDTLLFGSESGNLQELRKAAGFLAEEAELSREEADAVLARFRNLLKERLSQGQSFPKARASALGEALGLPADFSSNDVLGIEYLKAIFRQHAEFEPAVLQRDMHLKSAHRIREEILASEDRYGVLKADDFSDMLSYQLTRLHFEDAELSAFQDVSEDLAQSLSRQRWQNLRFTERINELKSKNLTYARISRALLHILLNIRKSDVEKEKRGGYIRYLRVLGVSENGRELLSALPEPLVVSPAQALKRNPELMSNAAFRGDLFAAELYQQLSVESHNDFTEKLIVL